MDKISFKLEVFEGPLDLLLQLINKNKLNIYDIPIAAITEQYFEALERMQAMDLEVTSEFLVMAARLIYIKSQLLLPKNNYDTQEEDPRTELVEKLLEYQRYKMASQFLKEREFSNKYIFFKHGEEIDPVVIPYEGEYNITELIAAFNDVLERVQRRMPPTKKPFEKILSREKVSVKDKVHYLRKLFSKKKKMQFSKIFDSIDTRPELVATFLALLELIKLHRVAAKYSDKAKDFVITTINSSKNEYEK